MCPKYKIRKKILFSNFASALMFYFPKRCKYTHKIEKNKEKFLTVQLVHKQEVKNASHHVL